LVKKIELKITTHGEKGQLGIWNQVNKLKSIAKFRTTLWRESPTGKSASCKQMCGLPAWTSVALIFLFMISVLFNFIPGRAFYLSEKY
jgi:hypothetical protein